VPPYPSHGRRQQVSIDGGTDPAWARNGNELFYLSLIPSTPGQADVYRVMAVPMTTGPRLTFGVARVLFHMRYRLTEPVRGYDVTPDGRRFLIVEAKDRPPIKATQMILAQNWVEELKRLVPTK
jgi:hypothetical protein